MKLKGKKTAIIRWGVLLSVLSFVITCRYMPDMAEGYARTIYPSLSAALSAFSSLFLFFTFIIVHLSLHFVKILHRFFPLCAKKDFEMNFLFFLRFPLKNAENYSIMTEISFFKVVKNSHFRYKEKTHEKVSKNRHFDLGR